MPTRLRKRLRRLARSVFPVWPPTFFARLLIMFRMTPVTRDEWGYDRGEPLDRWYIENFLARFGYQTGYAEGDIHGRVMELGDDIYARRYGAPGAEIEVLHVYSGHPDVTLVGNLETGEGIPKGRWDCIIITQTLHVIYDMRSTLQHLHDALRPGGVLLLTVPNITPACLPDRDHWGDYWRLTSLGLRRLLEESFPSDGVSVDAYGNVMTATGFLHGMSSSEFTRTQLTMRDPRFEVVIGARAVRAPA